MGLKIIIDAIFCQNTAYLKNYPKATLGQNGHMGDISTNCRNRKVFFGVAKSSNYRLPKRKRTCKFSAQDVVNDKF